MNVKWTILGAKTILQESEINVNLEKAFLKVIKSMWMSKSTTLVNLSHQAEKTPPPKKINK